MRVDCIMGEYNKLLVERYKPQIKPGHVSVHYQPFYRKNQLIEIILPEDLMRSVVEMAKLWGVDADDALNTCIASTKNVYVKYPKVKGKSFKYAFHIDSNLTVKNIENSIIHTALRANVKIGNPTRITRTVTPEEYNILKDNDKQTICNRYSEILGCQVARLAEESANSLKTEGIRWM